MNSKLQQQSPLPISSEDDKISSSQTNSSEEQGQQQSQKEQEKPTAHFSLPCHIKTTSPTSPHFITITNLENDTISNLHHALIQYTIFPTKQPRLGWCLIAVSDFGLCALYLYNPNEHQTIVQKQEGHSPHNPEQFLTQALLDTGARYNKKIKNPIQHMVLKRNDAYLLGDRQHIESRLENLSEPSTISHGLRIHLIGTTFQLSVYHALLKIPHGQVVTYGNLLIDSKQNNNKKRGGMGPLAVGVACGSNDVAVFVPCHRVIPSSLPQSIKRESPSDSSPGGYRWGSTIKSVLLAIEAGEE